MSQSIRVVHVVTRLNIGGVAIHVANLASGLSRCAFETVIVAGALGEGEGDMSDLPQLRSIKTVALPELGRQIKWTDDIIAFRRLLQILRKYRPHIVHTHTAKAGTLGRLAAYLCGVPAVFHTYHGHVFHGYFSANQTKLVLWVERLLARLTHQLIAISPAQLHELSEMYRIAPATKFTTIPLGVDLSELLSLPSPNAISPKRTSYRIGIVGRLVPIKNHTLFLEMAQRLLVRRKDVEFMIYGGGELESLLRARTIKLDIADHVRFCGWQRNLPQLYASLDLLVVTSKNEGTPMSVLEAMAAAKPVVATRVGGVPDLIRHGWNGMLAEPENADQLAQLVSDLLDDSRLAALLGKNGREFVKQQFTIQRMVDAVAPLYEEALRGSNDASARNIA